MLQCEELSLRYRRGVGYWGDLWRCILQLGAGKAVSAMKTNSFTLRVTLSLIGSSLSLLGKRKMKGQNLSVSTCSRGLITIGTVLPGTIHHCQHMQNLGPSWIAVVRLLTVVSPVSRQLDHKAHVHAHQYVREDIMQQIHWYSTEQMFHWKPPQTRLWLRHWQDWFAFCQNKQWCKVNLDFWSETKIHLISLSLSLFRSFSLPRHSLSLSLPLSLSLNLACGQRELTPK